MPPPSPTKPAHAHTQSRWRSGGRRSKQHSIEPPRARSGDLTGEREGREPSSQDEPVESSSSSTSSTGVTGAARSADSADAEGTFASSNVPEETPVPVDVALDVEELDANLFRSKTLWQPAKARGVFGGQVIGQAVASAARTTREDMTLHSLHCYFLLAGNRTTPIIYKVTRVRDGGSYATRQVDAQQHGRCIFTILLSYQVPEPRQPTFAIPLPEGTGGGTSGGGAGGLSTSQAPFASSQVLPLSSTFARSPTPNDVIASLPPPEESPLNEQRYVDMLRTKGDQLPKRLKASLEAVILDRLRSPVEVRNALPGMYDEDTSLPTEGYEQAFWLRTREPVGTDGVGGMEAQKAALSYLSDFQFLSTIPKALNNSMKIKMMASLDHSMWFYQDFDVHQWLLFVMQAQAASNGRGVVLGRIYRRDGTLVAVLAQEGMVREKLDAESPSSSTGQAKL